MPRVPARHGNLTWTHRQRGRTEESKTNRARRRHPASTSHGRMTEEQRQAAGIGQGLIRVAVGLEHIDDLKADLALGLDTLP